MLFTEVPLMAVMIEPFSIPAFWAAPAVDYFRYIDAGRHVIHFRKIRAYIRLAADPDIPLLFCRYLGAGLLVHQLIDGIACV